MTQHSDYSFPDTLGLIFQGEGLPRIAGRLLGFFVLEGGPFSFAELSERLQISRGSVSTNTRLLEDLGVIERVAKPGERQDYFVLAADPYVRLLERQHLRASRAREAVGRASHGLSDDIGGAQQRISDLSRFFSAMLDANEIVRTRLEDAPSQPNEITGGSPAPRPAVEADQQC